MRRTVNVLMGFVFLLASFQAEAKKTHKKDSRKLEKNIFFNDRVVKGKHQVPGEGTVTVENEKPVFNLLSIRSDFNDRREKERQRD